MPRSKAPRAAVSALLVALLSCVATHALAVTSELITGDINETDVELGVCANHTPDRQPLFGDLHVHTRYSLDASTMDTRNGPEEAYRFARGERIGIQPHDDDGNPLRHVQLSRPLDFAAVTDHAEVFGELEHCTDPDLAGYTSIQCRIYRWWPRAAFFLMNLQASMGDRPAFCGENGELCIEASRGPWQEMQRAADAATDRSDACTFTAFTAYEWTGQKGSTSANMHRNVIFANDAVPELPTSAIDEPEPEGLWDALERDCTGADIDCDVIVIPHNSNLGGGYMFAIEDDAGQPIDVDIASKRHRLERLVEIMQHKGDSECRTGVGTNDELCGFEKLDTTTMGARFLPWQNGEHVPRMFVRHVLQEGLAQEQRLGVNPFEYGIIASTDTHLGTPGLVEQSASFPGHGGAGKPPDQTMDGGLPDAIDFGPGGLAVVWAEENSRSSIFAALKRRETYGTSGPRIEARLFGGYDLPEDLCDASDRVARAYAGGMPMGGKLESPPEATAPLRFLVSARADAGVPGAEGTDLQRIQIVKGWLDGDELRERVVDVAGGENGATVDTMTCEPEGRGARELCAVWTDDAFDPGEPAFYYARVIENPTCRWSQRVCREAGVVCDGAARSVPPGYEDCCAPEHAKTIQQRAWTSPIWVGTGTP